MPKIFGARTEAAESKAMEATEAKAAAEAAAAEKAKVEAKAKEEAEAKAAATAAEAKAKDEAKNAWSSLSLGTTPSASSLTRQAAGRSR